MNNPFHQPKPDFKHLLIFGAGGHGREIAWLAKQCWGNQIEVTHIVDRPEFLAKLVNDHPTMLLADWVETSDTRYVVGLGDSDLRKKMAQLCESRGLVAATIMHPRVEASRWLSLQPGCVVFAGSVLTTNIELGMHTHVNVNCTISHDVSIGDFCTFSPGTHVSGNVRIGHRVFVGTGANIINGRPGAPLIIGDGAVIAAGACVTNSVESGAMMAGVPAVRKR